MSYNTLIHQFEIRYSNILDFPNSINSILSPFVRLSTNIGITNENSRREIIDFHFSEDFSKIKVYWDKIVFRSQNPLNIHIENNSLIEQVFFNIFKKISNIDSFGEVKNFLHYTATLKYNSEETKETSLETLKNRFIKKEGLEISPNLKEFALTMASGNASDGEYEEISLGNFVGKEDFNRRNIDISNPYILELLDKSGLLIESKYMDNSVKLDFALYKKITKKIIRKIESI